MRCLVDAWSPGIMNCHSWKLEDSKSIAMASLLRDRGQAGMVTDMAWYNEGVEVARSRAVHALR
mgnify:CR=1 FL=1